MASSLMLIDLIFVATGLALLAFLAGLERLKNRLQQIPVLPPSLRQRRRNQTGYALTALTLLLFLLGKNLLPLEAHPLGFVLYWWFTFTTMLGIFIFPALNYRDYAQQMFDIGQPEAKTEGQIFHRPDPPAAQAPAVSQFSGKGPTPPPTIH